MTTRQAIIKRCQDCIVSLRTSQCTDTDCYLHHFRNGIGNSTNNPKGLNRRQAIKSYCLWCCNNQIYEKSNCVSVDCPLHEFR